MANSEIPILFENKDVLVIDKPSGLMVHPDGRSSEKTLVDWVLEHYPKMKGVGEPLTLQNGDVIDRPGIVHRLDRDTSGALLLAKNQKAFLHLKKQFQDRDVAKVYHVFVYGAFKEKKGIINRPIGRSTRDFRLWASGRGIKGVQREAVTHYEVLAENKEISPDTAGVSFLEVRPKTGRTHQIRVHMKAVHHPVVADPLYAPKYPGLLGFTRVALHARSVAFELPGGKEVAIEAPYPADFEEALRILSRE